MICFVHVYGKDEVRAAFGVSETELQACLANGIIHYSPTIEVLLSHIDN